LSCSQLFSPPVPLPPFHEDFLPVPTSPIRAFVLFLEFPNQIRSIVPLPTMLFFLWLFSLFPTLSYILPSAIPSYDLTSHPPYPVVVGVSNPYESELVLPPFMRPTPLPSRIPFSPFPSFFCDRMTLLIRPPSLQLLPIPDSPPPLLFPPPAFVFSSSPP